jgi:hypothetical protein
MLAVLELGSVKGSTKVCRLSKVADIPHFHGEFAVRITPLFQLGSRKNILKPFGKLSASSSRPLTEGGLACGELTDEDGNKLFSSVTERHYGAP